jgi:anion-transporting  ArsA/GET3 family ATPase
VITIDPARRLADALGLPALDSVERELPDELRARAGLGSGGRLFAMLFDTRRALDELAGRLVSDPARLARIEANPIYRALGDALSGSREYAALEKLHALHASGRYDVIVVDTPPAEHVLDILDAPRHLAALLEGGPLGRLLRPATGLGRLSAGALRSGARTALRTLERLTGSGFPAALADFLSLAEGPLAEIGRRASAIHALLRSDACGFVLVAGPEPQQLVRAREFAARLGEERVRLVGAVINRVRRWPLHPCPGQLDPGDRESALARLEALLPRRDAEQLLAAAERQARLARRDAALGDRLAAALPLDPAQLRRIPLLREDPYGLAGLLALGSHLFAAAPPDGV